MKHCAFAIGFALILLAQPARADFRSCVRGLAEMARADGVSAATVERATRNLSYDPDIIKSEHSQPEFTTPIWDYIAGLVDDERVRGGGIHFGADYTGPGSGTRGASRPFKLA